MTRTRPCDICGGAHTELYHRKEKACLGCGEVLPIEMFGKRKKDGYHVNSRCSECAGDYTRERYRSHFRSRFVNMISVARSRARRKGLPCTITSADVCAQLEKQGGRCYFSGRTLTTEPGYWGASIDRLDPRQGYTPENVVVTCWRVNDMRAAMLPEEFIALCRDIAAKQGGGMNTLIPAPPVASAPAPRRRPARRRATRGTRRGST